MWVDHFICTWKLDHCWHITQILRAYISFKRCQKLREGRLKESQKYFVNFPNSQMPLTETLKCSIHLTSGWNTAKLVRLPQRSTMRRRNYLRAKESFILAQKNITRSSGRYPRSRISLSFLWAIMTFCQFLLSISYIWISYIWISYFLKLPFN